MGVGLGNIFEGAQIKLRPAGAGSNKKPVAAEKVRIGVFLVKIL